MSTPTCSQCLRPMTYTDKGWACTHREPRYKLEHDGMGTYISDDEIPVTQPPTEQGERYHRGDLITAAYSGLGEIPYEVIMRLEGYVLALIAREREAVAKAYGGCIKCYGKGYATVIEYATSRNAKWRQDPTRYCTCDRGRQLEAVVTAQREVAAKEARQRSVQEFTGWMDAAIHTRLAHIKTTRGKIKTDPGFKRDLSKFVEEEADAFLDTPNQQETKHE